MLQTCFYAANVISNVTEMGGYKRVPLLSHFSYIVQVRWQYFFFLQIIHFRDYNTLKPAICLPYCRFIVLLEHCVNYDVRVNIQLT